MAEPTKCPDCGSEIPADAPGGACPRCALGAALPSSPPVPTAAEVAAKLPGYDVLAVLGRGGMGVVFKARQKALDRIVALKVLPPAMAAAPGFSERFAREAKAMARLAHPNIVAVHEFGESGGLFYLVLEYVDGSNIREATAAGRVGPADALTIVPQICDALQYAHDRGVVHRDIKPENVLIARDGRVKIADFGLAKLADRESGDASLTGAGQVMGTLRYMAPEQWERPKDVDHRADIYSLGVVFYEMLTGELPMGRFEPPSKRASVDVRIDEVVMRSIERDRERRWQRADEMKTHVSALSSPAAPPPAAVVEKKKQKDDSHWDWEGPQGLNAVVMWTVAAVSAIGALAWDYGDWLWWTAGPAAITGAWCTAKWWSDRRAAKPEADGVQRPRIEALVRRLQAVHPTNDFDELENYYASADMATLRRMPTDVIAAKAPGGGLGLPVIVLEPGLPLSEYRVAQVTVESDHGIVTLDHGPADRRLVARVDRASGRWVFSIAPVERSRIPPIGLPRTKQGT